MTERLSHAVLPGVRPLTEREFTLFQGFIHREAGIFLAPTKKALLIGRLSKRMRELNVESFSDYYQRVLEEAEEKVRLFDAICTNETQFFREPQHFDFLERCVYPQWEAEAAASASRARRIRVWSAACSTGEEPYSLAMSLLARFPAERGWSVEVLATDLSTRALAKAEAGIYPLERTAHIPDALLRQFFLRGVGGQAGKVKVAPRLRSTVSFRRMNFMSDRWAASGQYDLIFCRNVLIYFDQSSKKQVVSRLLESLTGEGYFFLGHAESLHGSGLPVRSVSPTVYRKAQG